MLEQLPSLNAPSSEDILTQTGANLQTDFSIEPSDQSRIGQQARDYVFDSGLVYYILRRLDITFSRSEELPERVPNQTATVLSDIEDENA